MLLVLHFLVCSILFLRIVYDKHYIYHSGNSDCQIFILQQYNIATPYSPGTLWFPGLCNNEPLLKGHFIPLILTFSCPWYRTIEAFSNKNILGIDKCKAKTDVKDGTKAVCQESGILSVIIIFGDAWTWKSRFLEKRVNYSQRQPIVFLQNVK